MTDYTYTVSITNTETGEAYPLEIGEPCDHTWDMGDGCETCGDDHCLVICQECGQQDRACDD